MSESYNIAPGQQPFNPGSIMPVNKLSDRLVDGIGGTLAPAPVAPAPAVAPDKVVQIETELVKEEKTGTNDIKMCPACGLLLSDENEMKPSELEKDRWLRHILGEPRFEQTFTLFGGRLSVTFRSRTSLENDSIFNQLTDEVRSGEISEFAGVMSPAYFTRMNRLMLACSLVSVELKDGDVPKVSKYPEVTVANYPPVDDKDKRLPVLRANDKLTESCSEGQLGAIMVVHRRFEALIQTLMRHSDDPDFWSPTGADI